LPYKISCINLPKKIISLEYYRRKITNKEKAVSGLGNQNTTICNSLFFDFVVALKRAVVFNVGILWAYPPNP
jgi:hypothetical protein